MQENDEGAEEYLCQYTSMDNAFLILKNLTLKLGSITNSNDPFEKRIISLNDICDGVSKERLTRTFQDKLNKILRMFCFTAGDCPKIFDKEDYEDFYPLLLQDKELPYLKPHMWYSYGRNNTGACILLNKKKFESVIKKEFTKYYDIESRNISYKEFYSGFTYVTQTLDEITFSSADLKKQNADELLYDHIKNQNKDIYFEKDIDWQTENEYRYVCLKKPDVKDAPGYLPIGECLSGIIFGCDVPLSFDSKYFDDEMERLSCKYGIKGKKEPEYIENKDELIKNLLIERSEYENNYIKAVETVNMALKLKEDAENFDEDDDEYPNHEKMKLYSPNLSNLYIGKLESCYDQIYLDTVDEFYLAQKKIFQI